MRHSDNIRKIHIDNEQFAQQLRRTLVPGSNKSVTFTIRGYSMRPYLENERDKVVLAPPQPPQPGQVVLAEFAPRTYALHRIIKIDGDTITMQGDGNPLSQTETFTADKIVGTAQAFIRQGETISIDDRRWRRYSACWLALRPLRRPLLFIYRVIHKIFKR